MCTESGRRNLEVSEFASPKKFMLFHETHTDLEFLSKC